MKKKLFFVIFSMIFVLAGCGQKEKQQLMDVPSEDGKYHYENESLKFGLVLPAEFIYYQTQRKDYANFMDIEFFVPTSDEEYVNEDFPSYAKPIIVRAYEKNSWDNEEGFEKIKESGSKLFAIKFWAKIPSDWKDKWTEDMRKKIIDSFDLK